MANLAKLLLCLDQLALAKEQLVVREPESGRVAQILTDNAVELMVHHQAECIVALHGFPPRVPRPTKQQEIELLGQHLEPKLKLARDLAVITAEQSEFIEINHRYRNEVYHRGLRHDRVIWDIGWHYHSFACGLMPKLNTGFGVTFNPSRKTPSRLSRYGTTHQDFMRSGKDQLSRVAAEISAKVESPSAKFGVALGKTVAAQVKTVDEMLDWMVENDPHAKTREEEIIQTQLWAALFSDERRRKCKVHPQAAEVMDKARASGITHPIEILRQVLTPPITRDPIPSWLRRASGVTAEKDTVKALKKYDSLRLAMDDLAEDLGRAAGALDNHLDQLRGK